MIKKDDVEHHSFTENAMIVSKLKSEHAEAVIKDNADHHKVTDDAKIVLNDIKDAYTEVTTRDVAIVGYKMLDKVTAERKERPDTHLRTDLKVSRTGGTNRADPGMESPDSLLTHE